MRRSHAGAAAWIFAAVLLVVPRVAAAQCGLGNQCASVDTLLASASPAPAGGSVDITCTAHDPDGTVTNLVFTADGGTFANGTNRIRVAVAGQSASATVAWAVPQSPGSTFTITCTPWDNGTAFGGPTEGLPSSLAVPVAAVGPPPQIVSLTATPAEVFPAETAVVVASVVNPGGGALSYAWSASAGTIAGDRDAVVWTAPAGIGFVQVTLTVTAGGQTARAGVVIDVVFAHADAPIAQAAEEGGLHPRRLACDASGNVYVTDPRRHEVVVLTPLGAPLRRIPVGVSPSGVAVAPDGVTYVADVERGLVEAYPMLGPSRVLGGGAGGLSGPLDLALDPHSGKLYVADGEGESVKVYDERGALAATWPLPGVNAAGVDVDPAGPTVYVSDARGGRVLVLGGDGKVQRTIGQFGTGAADLTRAAGVLVRGGLLLVVDAHQSRVQVYGLDGTLVGAVGVYGDDAGQLRVPLDPVIDGAGRLLVANADAARLEVFTLQNSTVPFCPGDMDCDGMPDAWEIAMGFDPRNPADAWQDADDDGLPNVLEYRLGTNPHDPDTDHDGVRDSAEVLAGQNPLDPGDNRPVADAGPSRATDPAFVRLDGTGSHDPNGEPLTFTWRQISGQAVELRDATSAIARFVGRAAGAYGFGLRVSDGKSWSPEATVEVDVRDVAPTADAGPDLSAGAGATVALDGRFSSDANGQPLSYRWSQVAGPPVQLSSATATRPWFVAAATGVHTFELVVNDGGQAGAPDRVNVLVDDRNDHVPTAWAPALVDGRAGDTVMLDGSGSADTDRDALHYAWRQTAGAPVVLAGANAAVASFVPLLAGVYEFELVVSDGAHESLPSAVTAVVRGPYGGPPVAAAGYDQRARVLDDVYLGCGGSWAPDGSAVACRWTQVEGTHVAIERAGDAAVRFAPLESGTYVFELSVESAAGAGTRDRVTIVADDPENNFVPVARGEFRPQGGQALPGSLSSAASFDHGGGGALNAVWTQVEGPHLLVRDAGSGAPGVVPEAGHSYAFEVRVDDGVDRSPPARVVWSAPLASTPVARAGGDRFSAPARPLVLDGSASTIAGRRSPLFEWSQIGGPRSAVMGAREAALLQVVPPALSGVTLRFLLDVGDGELRSAADAADVHVVDAPLVMEAVSVSGGDVVVVGRGSAFDGAALAVPAGALASPVQVALGEVAASPPGTTAHPNALYVGPAALPLIEAATLEIPLAAAAWLRLGDGAVPVVMRWDQDAGAWLPVEGAKLAPNGARIDVPLRKAGLFHVVAR